MTIVEKMRSLADFQARRYVVFVLSYTDAEELRNNPGMEPPPEHKWTFHGIHVIAADIYRSYGIEEQWEHPIIHML